MGIRGSLAVEVCSTITSDDDDNNIQGRLDRSQDRQSSSLASSLSSDVS
jgi:hypothetical protein